MPGYPDAPFPKRPFYSCDLEALVVIDQSEMQQLLRGGDVNPWFRLEVGPGNVIDSAPVKVEGQSGTRVTVRCSAGSVEIDFTEETARKTDADGRSFIYMGALDEANDGNGWMPVR